MALRYGRHRKDVEAPPTPAAERSKPERSKKGLREGVKEMASGPTEAQIEGVVSQPRGIANKRIQKSKGTS